MVTVPEKNVPQPKRNSFMYLYVLGRILYEGGSLFYWTICVQSGAYCERFLEQ